MRFFEAEFTTPRQDQKREREASSRRSEGGRKVEETNFG